MEEVFLNNISCTICIEFNEDDAVYQATPLLLNQFVRHNSSIKTIYWANTPELIQDDEINDVSIYTPLSNCNDPIVYTSDLITLESCISPPKTYTSKGGFTISGLLSAVLDYELLDRPNTDWFGGIDAHHIYFEGLCKNKRGTYTTLWGS